jgi:general secretion pathway protein E
MLRRAETDGPVIRFVQEKLTDAVLQGASDVHVECTEDGYAVRFRLNGVLVPQRVDGALDALAVIARLKVMAGVNVAERRLPQDGRLETTIAGRKIDFRFSSLPTHFGESIVARVLDPKALRLGWDRLGFEAEVIARIKAILDRPSGLFLVTGPTGSGKTTTLYTAVGHLNQPKRKIVTVEDPVEYNLRGVQQVQVHEEIGLTFARVLRGVLRHDPNVILIGEIRDAETAEIAVRAAQVGRLVLSTLHTNSAAGALNRLVDLGVPEFLVRDVLRGVLGQELVLTPCPVCGGAGCKTCERTGVGGRRLRAELMEY